MYGVDDSKEIINLKGAKLEKIKENEFLIITQKKEHHFIAEDSFEREEWEKSLWKAILLNNPDMVNINLLNNKNYILFKIYVKIEPVNLSKVIIFYDVKYDLSQNKKREKNDQEE